MSNADDYDDVMMTSSSGLRLFGELSAKFLLRLREDPIRFPFLSYVPKENKGKQQQQKNI